MKTIISILGLVISTMGIAQVSFAAKANVLVPTSKATWDNFKSSVIDTYTSTGKSSVGYNVGVSLKVDLPKSFFIMPELYYTTFKNEFTDPLTNVEITSKNNRVDLPVLVGMDLYKEFFGIFVGPVASYQLSNENQYEDFKENAKNNFTVGYQFGAQARIKKVIINARYEGAIGKDERNYINDITNYTVRYDNRPSIFLIGLGYKF